MNSLFQPGKPALTITHKGSTRYDKMSFPVHCGLYRILETSRRIFHFNLRNEIIRIKDKLGSWNHPHEWLQRTLGNDWIYYSTGGYTGVFEATGEYYLPNLSYSSNNLLGGKPFTSEDITTILDSWYNELEEVADSSFTGCTERDLFEKILHSNGPEHLRNQAEKFHNIIGGQISVLPPDARHVGYNIIPLSISKGCLYKCSFCRIKNKHPFRKLSEEEIENQLSRLQGYYGKDIINYNSIFLGEHDALAAGEALITKALHKSLSSLQFDQGYPEGSNLFFFGSASSFLESSDNLYRLLQEFGGNTYINLGLESPDQKTLDQLGKPITAAMVRESFKKMYEINTSFQNVEITANLLMDQSLPDSHYSAVESLLRDSQTHTQSKGTIYFSPLSFNSPSRARLFEFHRLKLMSRFPTFLYIIQRL